MEDETNGLTHLYHGPGKGKTTAAVGLCVRALGHGQTVTLLQFMKGTGNEVNQYGEVQLLMSLDDAVVKQFPTGHAQSADALSDAEQEGLNSALDIATETLGDGQSDLVVLDEILTLHSIGVIDEQRLLAVLQSKADSVELVITGREAPTGVIDMADYVSYIGSVKHPFQRGISARVGIEY